jgi:hypothetical protein
VLEAQAIFKAAVLEIIQAVVAVVHTDKQATVRQALLL